MEAKYLSGKCRALVNNAYFCRRKRYPMHLKAFLFCCALALSAALSAQDLADRLGLSDPSIRVLETGDLAFTFDNLSFFKDNEFEGEHAKGYTLPGLWIQPRLTYQPTTALRFEAGFHATVFDGANKYPCYAYHDIGRWKGHQYQSGAHLLPFFRAQAQIGRVQFVFGDIFGGANHRVMEPLMNPEVNLTQDPEMGFQLLVDLPGYWLDAWVNWQSYIFEEDAHQEAFTVGLSQRLQFNAPSSPIHYYIPLNVLAQHRGGEQDVTDMGVQTLVNGGIGLGIVWNVGGRVLRRMTGEASVLACWQQSGQLWPYNKGLAGSLSVDAELGKEFRLFGSLVASGQFVSLYGVPFYSTLSQKNEGGRFSHFVTPHFGFEWSHRFMEDYALGVKADVYPLHAGRLTLSDGQVLPAAFSNNFSFGVYLRMHPRFLLKRFLWH